MKEGVDSLAKSELDESCLGGQTLFEARWTKTCPSPYFMPIPKACISILQQEEPKH